MNIEIAWVVILVLNRKSTELGLKYHLLGVTECIRMLESLKQKNSSALGDFRYSHIDQVNITVGQDTGYVFLGTIKYFAE